MFIELLLMESQRKGLKVREPELFRLVEKNCDEITEALEKGYSWKQITKAFAECYRDEWKFCWAGDYIRRYYERIRKEKGNEG
ncbi:MAG: hypothetical protein IJF90_05750 [Synergistaceae bacterium]|nr:hypothetical protein [Synergistaceae bacterium]